MASVGASVAEDPHLWRGGGPAHCLRTRLLCQAASVVDDWLSPTVHRLTSSHNRTIRGRHGLQDTRKCPHNQQHRYSAEKEWGGECGEKLRRGNRRWGWRAVPPHVGRGGHGHRGGGGVLGENRGRARSLWDLCRTGGA